MKKKIVSFLIPAICASMLTAMPVSATESSQAVKSTIDASMENLSKSQPEEPSKSTDIGASQESEAMQEEKSAPLNTTDDSEHEDSISLVETGPVIDADGNVTIIANTKDDITLPLTMTMKGSEKAVTFTISRSGQQVKIKPDEYRITKAVDGNGKKLPAKAWLTIPEEGGTIYLDFNKSEVKDNVIINVLKTNIFFIPLAIIMYLAFLWYMKHIAR